MTLTNRLSNPGLRTLAIGLVAMALALGANAQFGSGTVRAGYLANSAATYTCLYTGYSGVEVDGGNATPEPGANPDWVEARANLFRVTPAGYQYVQSAWFSAGQTTWFYVSSASFPQIGNVYFNNPGPGQYVVTIDSWWWYAKVHKVFWADMYPGFTNGDCFNGVQVVNHP